MGNKRKFMVLGAALTNLPAIRAMAEMQDVEVMVVDGDELSPARDLPVRFESIDIKDTPSVLRLAREWGAEGVYAINDHAQRTASSVADILGLCGISAESVAGVLDKGQMRDLWRMQGLLQPDYWVVTGTAGVLLALEDLGGPVILKPVDCGGGGRGVVRIDGRDDVSVAFERAREFGERMIVERFIEGMELSVEVFKHHDQTELVAIGRRISTPGVSHVAAAIEYPCRLNPTQTLELQKLLDRAMSALGLSAGPGHFEVMLTAEGDFMLIEMGARAGGGHILHPIVCGVSGLNYPRLLVKHFLGDEVELEVNNHKSLIYNFIYSHQEGRLKGVSGLESLKDRDGIGDVQFWKRPGDWVNLPLQGRDRIGCVLVESRDLEMARGLSEAAMGEISLEVEGA